MKDMTQEDKELLLKDLSARLRYGVKVYYQRCELPFILFEVNLKGEVLTLTDDTQTNYFVQYVENSKPYLRPMSSMTEEEVAEFESITDELLEHGTSEEIWNTVIDWLNARHFDHRHLIEKGLALKAPDGMYNLKEK